MRTEFNGIHVYFVAGNTASQTKISLSKDSDFMFPI